MASARKDTSIDVKFSSIEEDFLRHFFAVAKNYISKKKHLRLMKYKRNKRFKKTRDRVILRDERKYLLQLESNPYTLKDGKWTHKDKRFIRDLVFVKLPLLAYRLRGDSLSQLRVILLYEHYLTFLNSFRKIHGTKDVPWNTYLNHRLNRIYSKDDGCTIGTLELLFSVPQSFARH